MRERDGAEGHLPAAVPFHQRGAQCCIEEINVARPDSGYAASKHSGLTRAWNSIPGANGQRVRRRLQVGKPPISVKFSEQLPVIAPQRGGIRLSNSPSA
jgi:hypothetical protein